MKKFVVVVIVLMITSWGIAKLSTEFSSRARVFLIMEKIRLKNLPKDVEELCIWIPYPANDVSQEISDFKIESPYESRLITDKDYGNKIIYLKFKSDVLIGDPPEISLSFKVLRKEIGASNNSVTSHRSLLRFLKSDRLVPVNGKIKRIAQEITRGKDNGLEKVRVIYDYIIDTLTYSKDDPKICGIGDSLLTLQYEKGICTDYHSLFISLVRSLGIPAKFEIGYRIPEEKSEGILNGYHCWAKFYLKDKGWIPVDISEADKHPERRDYFFGHIDENRVHFNTGRDIRLKYAKNKNPLNFFIYPYAEESGNQVDVDFEIRFKEERR